jgi:hypothetical protein
VKPDAFHEKDYRTLRGVFRCFWFLLWHKTGMTTNVVMDVAMLAMDTFPRVVPLRLANSSGRSSNRPRKIADPPTGALLKRRELAMHAIRVIQRERVLVGGHNRSLRRIEE